MAEDNRPRSLKKMINEFKQRKRREYSFLISIGKTGWGSLKEIVLDVFSIVPDCDRMTPSSCGQGSFWQTILLNRPPDKRWNSSTEHCGEYCREYSVDSIRENNSNVSVHFAFRKCLPKWNSSKVPSLNPVTRTMFHSIVLFDWHLKDSSISTRSIAHSLLLPNCTIMYCLIFTPMWFSFSMVSLTSEILLRSRAQFMSDCNLKIISLYR